MGSALKFIQSAADPIGDIVAHVAGPNSFIAKDMPSWAKYINPEMAQLGAEHQAEFTAPSGVLSSGTASGQAATLAGAQSGYYTSSHAAANDPRVAPSSVIGAPGGMNYLTGTGANAVAPTVTGKAPAPDYAQAVQRAAATQPAAPTWTGAQPTSSVDYVQAAQRALSTQGNGSNMWGGYGY